ncbi:hypothetical protein [Blastococcus mobilis]|uniref:Uncharacterized protein n=1 Tax=Blastococcus mobilis TaxID=1938746 RepID=A0A238VYL1_9ACTN|nr:hypothetical protein [Blastococcus mobilis]SNR38943.1 hypothetical protein SAMN06272737_105138 [Blastococcus mobilis]
MKACVKGCGHEHDPRKCTGHVDGEDGSLRPCRKAPIKGATVCRSHGGAAPQVKAKAEVVRREEAAGRALTRWAKYADLTGEVNPVDALLDEFRRTSAVVAYLDGATSAEDEVWEDKAGRLQLDPRIDWWQAERDRLTKLVQTMHSIGISERQTRVLEAQASQLVTVIRGVLDGLNLTAEQRALVPGVLRAQLAAIASAPAPGEPA